MSKFKVNILLERKIVKQYFYEAEDAWDAKYQAIRAFTESRLHDPKKSYRAKVYKLAK